ncbi:MAG: adenylosuccinate synthase [Dehalococcoidia bacterium]
MPVTAIVGGQWGDEGKGKIVDLVAEKADIVARYSGGTNAGHTVVNSQGTFKLHLIPSGIFHPKTRCLIGNGVVISPRILISELDTLQDLNIDTSRFLISDRAHLIMPYHFLLDELEESARGNKAIGTTKQGIGPAYMDKAARMGLRVGELVDKDVFRKRLHNILHYKNQIITRVFEAEPLSPDEICEEYFHYADRLEPYISETHIVINEALQRGEHVVLEGAQGTMLDIDFGTYPYVTSSPPTAWGACLGTGLSPARVGKIVGVFKAYTTRVGAGPFPTELTDQLGEEIRTRGNEYGTTTGRPRRCGWFDAVAARFSSDLNGFTGVAITKFDILDTCPTVRICTGYKVDERVLHSPPANLGLLERCTPTYEDMPGWMTTTSNVRKYEDLPPEAQKYITRIGEILGCPVDLVSVGANREQSIIVNPII